jgi:hypothetical protein
MSGSKKAKCHKNYNSIRKLLLNTVKIAAYTALEIANITTELITGKEMEKVDLNGGERAVILKDGKLSSATLNKTKADAYETEIRIGVIFQRTSASLNADGNNGFQGIGRRKLFSTS